MSTFHIRSGILSSFPDVITELGGNPDALLQAAQIPPIVFNDPEAPIAHTAFLRLLSESVKETGCEHLGLILGERVSDQSFGLLGMLARSSSTVEEAINVLLKHLKVFSTGITREIHSDGHIAHLDSIFENKEMERSNQAVQMSVTMSWNLCRKLTQNLWHPTSIYFTFDEPRNKTFYRRFFNVPIIFNSEFNGIVFHTNDLSLKLPQSDTHLHRELKKQIEKIDVIEVDFITEVERIIQKNLTMGLCSIDAAVQFFPFQKRTFQEKLKKSDLSYQEILDRIRFSKAELHLASSSISISQLADILCYTSVGVFSTVFRKRYGITPSKWRKEHKKIT